jgi:hypothetical protein
MDTLCASTPATPEVADRARIRRVLAGLLAVPIVLGGVVTAGAADGVLPPARYNSDRGRQLAVVHAEALRRLDAELYHCLPWVEIHKDSLGFFRPRHSAQDERYLSVRIFVEQDPSAAFAALSPAERASAMFSRYVGPMLRRMTRDPLVRQDPRIDGLAIVIDWLKQTARGKGDRPVHETIAVFVDRASAIAYVGGSAGVGDLVARATVLGFDGETALGPLRLSAWNDDFVSTYKIKNYEVAPGVSCE